MRRSVLVTILCSVVVSLAGAQQSAKDAPASKQDVERFLDAMHTHEMMKSMMVTMAAQMREMVHEQVTKVPNLPPNFEAQQDRRMDEFVRTFPVDEMVEAMIPVYQRHFTKGEMDDLVAFYSTPTGQKMVRELPAITAEAMQSSQAIIQGMIAQEMRHIQDEIATIQKQGRAPSAKPE